ncbi:MAG: SprT-like domain-containing protein [Fimbriimonadaceae bacterium]
MKESAEELLSQLMISFPLSRRPVLVWKKMSSSAGKAYFHTWQISLSTVLIIDEERMKDTLVHEFAHLLAFERHGRRGAGHGQAWRQAMADLGAPATVRHTYEVVRRPVERKLIYKCTVCGTEIRRVQPLKRGYVYTHRGCGGSLRKA